MNYATLLQTIQDYTENDDTTFVNNIPTFVKQAEKFIYNSTTLPASNVTATSSLIAGNQYLELPTDYLRSFYFNITVSGEQRMLLWVDTSFMREAFPSASTTGVPAYYTQFNETSFIVAPTPTLSYNCELSYFAYPESIVTASTSFLGDNFDMALLYGSLVNAYTFMKGEDSLLATYQKLFAVEMEQVMKYGNTHTDSDAYKRGQR